MHKHLTRGELIKLGVAGVTASLVGCRPEEVEARRKAGARVPNKNIVVINLDDCPDWMINSFITPKIISRLAAKGVRFRDFHANNPQCGPSRCMLLKGKYTHHSWMPNSNNDTADKFKFVDNDTLATRLQAVGMRTGLFGKYLNGYSQDPTYIPPGWSKWWAYAGGYEQVVYQASVDGVVKDFDKSTHPPGQKAFDNAIAWIEGGDQSKPYFAYIAPQSPHGPYDETVSRYGSHKNDFDGSTYTSPGTQEDTPLKAEDKPGYIANDAYFTPEEQAKAQVHVEGKKEELRVVDDLVNNFLNVLFNRGDLENTIIVLTVDNGYLLGEHGGMDGKHEPYNESVRVTAIMRGPNWMQNIETSALAGMIDVAPTLVQSVGADTTGQDGRPLQAILQTGNTPADWRNAILLEGPHYGWYGMIDRSNGRYTYVERDAYIDELYDDVADPYQLNNKIYYNTATPEEVAAFSAKLNALKTCNNETCRVADRV